MNILYISHDLSGGDMSYRLKKEGHTVKLFISDKDQKHNMDGMVEKTEDWKKELSWVGKDGLIIFDYTGYGKTQDRLRREGYSVVGGSEFGDAIENDRQYGQKILSTCGMEIIPSTRFCGATDAIRFIEKNPRKWVVKQNGHINTIFNYVGEMEDGRDVISILKNYGRNNKEECALIDLQEKIDGVEIGVGRYFNGHDWVGPIEINIEHKGLFNNNIGPKTFEMGTLMWYEEDENNKLFTETLGKMKDYLRAIDFRGDIDINCIINEEGLYPLEITSRFGWPSTHLQEEMHLSSWVDFLKAVADKKPYDLQYKKGYGLVVLVATPPFPYSVKPKKYSPEGLEIMFRRKMSEEDMQHIHLEEVSLRRNEDGDHFYISSSTGFIMHVSGAGKTIEEARKNTYALMDDIVIPKMFYRNDIGEKFMEEGKGKLEKWGWI